MYASTVPNVAASYATPDAASQPASSVPGDKSPFAALAEQALDQKALAQSTQSEAAANEQNLPRGGDSLPPAAATDAAGSQAGDGEDSSREPVGDAMGLHARTTLADPAGDNNSAASASDSTATDGSDPSATLLMPWLVSPVTGTVAVPTAGIGRQSDSASGTLALSGNVVSGTFALRNNLQAMTTTRSWSDRVAELDGIEGGAGIPASIATADEFRLVTDPMPTGWSSSLLASSLSGDAASQLPATLSSTVLAQSDSLSALGVSAALAGYDAPFGKATGADPATAPRLSSGSPTVTIPHLLNDPHWPEQFAARVDWLTGTGMTDARIAINPPDLGPIDIHISLHDQQARIHFAVQHDSVRDAVQDSLPRLRDLLQQSGLQLANADVSTGRQDQSRPAPDLTITYASADDAHATLEPTPAATSYLRVGFVDTYI